MSNYPGNSNGENPYVMNAEQQDAHEQNRAWAIEDYAAEVLDNCPLDVKDIPALIAKLSALYVVSKDKKSALPGPVSDTDAYINTARIPHSHHTLQAMQQAAVGNDCNRRAKWVTREPEGKRP